MNAPPAGGGAPKGTASLFADYAVYLAVAAVYCVPFITARDLFYAVETRYGGILREMIDHGAWMTLTISDQPYLDKPPLFFSLLRLAAWLTGSTEPWVFYAVVAVTAFVFLIGCHAFLRSVGVDRATTRLTTLLVAAVPWIAIHMQTVRMDFLFGGLILFSLACYARGIARFEANGWTVAAGLLAGLAVLVKGPFGAFLPIAPVAAFLAINRNPRRLLRADFLLSLLLAGLLVVGWLLLLRDTAGGSVIKTLFAQQVIERAVTGRDATRPWWLYVDWVALTLVPWLLLAPLFAWQRYRLAAFPSRSGLWGESWPGRQLLPIYLGLSLLMLGVVAQRAYHYLLPVVPALMLPTAIAYRRLEARYPLAVDWFYVALALAVLSAIVAGEVTLGFLPADLKAHLRLFVQEPTLHRTLAAMSLAVLPLAGAALLRGQARVIANIVSLAVLIAGLKATLAPDLNRAYSPKTVAAAFEGHVPEAAPIAVYDLPRGAFSYGFRHPLQYFDDLDALGRALSGGGRAYVIARERDSTSFAGFEALARSRIEATDLVLLSRPPRG